MNITSTLSLRNKLRGGSQYEFSKRVGLLVAIGFCMTSVLIRWSTLCILDETIKGFGFVFLNDISSMFLNIPGNSDAHSTPFIIWHSVALVIHYPTFELMHRGIFWKKISLDTSSGEPHNIGKKGTQGGSEF